MFLGAWIGPRKGAGSGNLSDKQNHMPNQAKNIEEAYQSAQERYARLGVETDRALKKLAAVSISMHCWQGDDVGGFENMGAELGGGRTGGGQEKTPAVASDSDTLAGAGDRTNYIP